MTDTTHHYSLTIKLTQLSKTISRETIVIVLKINLKNMKGKLREFCLVDVSVN